MLYKVVLVSVVQQSESIEVYIYPLYLESPSSPLPSIFSLDSLPIPHSSFNALPLGGQE